MLIPLLLALPFSGVTQTLQWRARETAPASPSGAQGTPAGLKGQRFSLKAW